MKTLSLEFSLKSDYYGVWIIAPLGTKVDGCGNYSFEQKINCYDQRSINNTINNFKTILQGFYDNVTSGSYTLNYCLGSATGGVKAGQQVATPSGIAQSGQVQ